MIIDNRLLHQKFLGQRSFISTKHLHLSMSQLSSSVIYWYKRFLCGVGEHRVEAERLNAVVGLVLGPVKM